MAKALFDQDDLISTYSRAQAIEDGQLIDVSAVAREAGIRFPVALTAAVWGECVKLPMRPARGDDEAKPPDPLSSASSQHDGPATPSEVEERHNPSLQLVPAVTGQDVEGRLWDVLFVLATVMRRAKGNTVDFEVLVRNDDRPGEPPAKKLKAICGPGDDAEPVITVMFPNED